MANDDKQVTIGAGDLSWLIGCTGTYLNESEPVDNVPLERLRRIDNSLWDQRRKAASEQLRRWTVGPTGTRWVGAGPRR